MVLTISFVLLQHADQDLFSTNIPNSNISIFARTTLTLAKTLSNILISQLLTRASQGGNSPDLHHSAPALSQFVTQGSEQRNRYESMFFFIHVVFAYLFFCFVQLANTSSIPRWSTPHHCRKTEVGQFVLTPVRCHYAMANGQTTFNRSGSSAREDLLGPLTACM